MKIKFLFIFSFIYSVLFLGCTGSRMQSNYPSNTIPPTLAEDTLFYSTQPSSSDGSLWTETSSAGHFFTDPKARTIGDIVTVDIVENASASGNASTKAGKKSSLSAKITSLFGIEKSIAGKNPNFDPSNMLSASTDTDFDGSGEISRSSKVTATITARVVKVLPNKNLFIRGNREVTINNEQQLLVIQGIIRPEDISPENTISSASIAEAKIIYTGKGIVSDKQSPGWLSKAIDKIWPF